MRLPLATDISSRDGTLAKDSLMKNAFAEKVGEEFDVFKRPGLTQAYDLGAGQGQGLVSWKGTFFTVRGSTLVQGPTASPIVGGATWAIEATPTGTPVSINKGGNYYDSGTDTLWYNGSGVARQVGTGNLTTFAGNGLGATVSESVVWFLGALWTIGGYYVGPGTGAQDITKSTDNGDNFVFQVYAPFTGRMEPLVYVIGSTLYVYGGRNGPAGAFRADLWKSTDGINWTQVSSPGLPTDADASAVAVSGTTVVIVVGNAVYKATNGETFSLVSTGAWTAIKHSSLSFHDGALYLVADTDDVYRSSNNGASWSQATTTGAFGTSNNMHSASSTLRVTTNAGVIWRATDSVPGGDTYTLTGASDLPISFSQTSGAASTEYLFLKTTGKAWVLTFGSPGTLTAVTDVDYPATTVPGAVYLDGYFFVMTPAGEIYNSGLEVPTSWGALDFISAEIEPDDAVALGKHMNYVVAFKSTTTELFYDAANASGSPLARLSNAAIQVGCANGYSIAALDAGLFFISKFRSNQKSVHYFPKDGLQPVEIANPSIKRILTAADTSTVHCFACQLSGHSFYVITLPTEGLTLAYDLTTQTWAQWTFLSAAAADSVTALTQSGGIATATATAHGFADGDPVTIAGATPSGYNGDVNIKYVDANTFTYPVSSALSTPATGTITATGWTAGYFPFGFYTNALSKDYIQHETSGKIYEISSDYGDDAGAPIDVTVRTPPLNQGSIERKNMSRLAVVGDNTTGTLLVRYSDDDYVTFSKYRPIDLSTTNKQVRRLGDYRERALDFRYTGDNKIRIRSIDIE